MKSIPKFFAVTLILATCLRGQTLLTGLVGYWSFNEGSDTLATDTSGNGNNGTLLNGPTWVTGKSGTGLSFDGVNDRVVATAAPANFPTGSSSRTIALWAKWSGNEVSVNGGAGYQSFFQYGTPGVNNETFGFERGGDGFRGNLYLLGWNHDVPSETSVAFTAAGVWTHMAVVYDNPANTVKFYINGTAAGVTPTYAFNTVLNGTGFIIGSGDSPDHWHGNFSGALDEVYLYNRALSATEIGTLMTAGAIPEPATYAMLFGLAALGFATYRRRKQSI